MENIIIPVALLLLCGLAVAMTAVRLPGTWFLVAAALGYGWFSGWQHIGAVTISVLGGIALIGEVLELLASVVIAKRAGASQQAAWGGLIGGFLGMIFLTVLVPIPLLGTVIGALVGCFAGAAIAEFAQRGRAAHGAKVGLFAALGFLIGTVGKIALALVMAGVLLTSVVCSPTPPADVGLFVDPDDLLAEYHTDARRARDGALVPYLHAFDDLRPVNQIGRRHAPCLVQESLNDLVPDGGSVVRERIDREFHGVGFRRPYTLDHGRACCRKVVEPRAVVHLLDPVPGQRSDGAKHARLGHGRIHAPNGPPVQDERNLFGSLDRGHHFPLSVVVVFHNPPPTDEQLQRQEFRTYGLLGSECGVSTRFRLSWILGLPNSHRPTTDTRKEDHQSGVSM